MIMLLLLGVFFVLVVSSQWSLKDKDVAQNSFQSPDVFLVKTWLQINQMHPSVLAAILGKHARATDQLFDTRLPRSPQSS